MQFVRDSQIELAAIPTYGLDGRPRLVVVMKATYALDDNQGCRLAEVQVPCSGDVFRDDDPELSTIYSSDFSLYKAKGECLLTGTCRPPGNQLVTETVVTFQVGSVQKELSVFGDRYWKHGLSAMKPSPPVPFTEMPLSWESAFGGDGVTANPVGAGLKKVTKDGRERTYLPNIEDRQQLITSPHSRPEPAGTFPLPPTWASRLQYGGTCDAKYMETRYPGFPEDFDPTFFQSAPEDQRISGFWRGDETIVLGNLVQDAPKYATKLPGHRPRCFVHPKTRDEDPSIPLEEVSLELDTIHVDTDRMEVYCVWRGGVPLSDLEASEISYLYALHEEPNAALSKATVEEQYRQTWQGILEKTRSFIPAPLMVTNPEESESETDPDEMPTMTLQALSSEEMPTMTLPAVASLAQDPDADEDDEMPTMTLSALLPGAATDVDDDEEMPTMTLPSMGTLPTGEAAAEEGEASVKTPEDRINEVFDQMKEQMAALGVSTELLKAPPANAAPPKLEPPDPEELRAQLEEMGLLENEEIKEGLEDLIARSQENPPEPEPEKEAKPELPLHEQLLALHSISHPIDGDFSGVQLGGAELQGLSAENALLLGANFHEANLTEAKLAGASLAGADLRGAQLAGVDLSGADLQEARLDGANLKGATLDGANLCGASLREACLETASLKEAELHHADLEGASLLEADLSAADLFGAKLTGADAQRSTWVDTRLMGTIADKVDFRNSNLTLLRASHGASFQDASFTGCKAAGSRWMNTQLSRAAFSFSDLEGANFMGASLVNATLDGCQLMGSNFQGAALLEAQMIKSNLFEANFRTANLVDADLRGSNLYGCEFFEAITLGAKFELANLDATRLEKS